MNFEIVSWQENVASVYIYWKHLAGMQFGLDGVRSYHSKHTI